MMMVNARVSRSELHKAKRHSSELSQPRSAPLLKDRTMEIESTTFGNITIDGKTYEHDVIIRLSGEVVKRKKKLSKKHYGTSHVVSKEEAKFVLRRGASRSFWLGQEGNVQLSAEAEAYFAKRATGG